MHINIADIPCIPPTLPSTYCANNSSSGEVHYMPHFNISHKEISFNESIILGLSIREISEDFSGWSLRKTIIHWSDNIVCAIP
jgi:hypothetical protein